MTTPIIEIRDLSVEFQLRAGTVKALANINFALARGKTTCVVGESGSGKSVTTRSIMQLNRHGRFANGSILLHDEDGATTDITKLAPNSPAMRSIRGKEIGIIFQEPMTALSPVHKVGEQIEEPIRIHLRLPKQQAREMALEIMASVGIPNPAQRYNNYPYQLSGGLRQRAAIAMALACRPRILIADEPTTALDVTTQANVLDLLSRLQREMGMTVMFITHDLGVVAEIADHVIVMYMGTVVETGDVDTIFHNPKHPYTKALLASVPTLSTDRSKPLPAIRGMVPHALARPQGCVFHTRCDHAVAGVCERVDPPPHQIKPGHVVRCVHYGDQAAVPVQEMAL